jgi:ABC-type phosphate transport system substrate-binding protein
LKDIYLLSTLKWSDGTNIVVFDNREKSIHEKFFDFIGIKDIMTVKMQWMRFQLSGEARAPELVNGDDKMLDKVASIPGAVGYVNLSKAKSNGVKVIAIID